MAKYKVEQFSSKINNNSRGYPNLFIFCKLLNNANNPSIREYQIIPDRRHPDLNRLDDVITSGFNHAKEFGEWVEIREYKERMYLFLTLPNCKQQIQVSGTCSYSLRPTVLKRTY